MGDLFRRFYDGMRLTFPDIGTSCLGIAALFFVRSVPTMPSFGFNYWLLGISLAFFLSGLFLRAFYRD